jgi:hypothetical protein
LTAPTGFTISETSGSDYSSSIILPYSPTITKTIYCIFEPTLEQSYNNSLTIATTGYTTINLDLLGLGIGEAGDPTLTVTPSDIDFGSVTMGNTSTEFYFDIVGTDLTNHVIITPPEDVTVSVTVGSGYETSLDITPVDGNVILRIYCIWIPTTLVALDDSISIVSSPATTQYVDVIGTSSSTVVYTTPGTYNTTVPVGCTSLAIIATGVLRNYFK